MLLADLLLLEAADLKNEMKRLFDEVSRKYFNEYSGFEYPKFAIQSNMLPAAGSFSPDANKISVDRDYANDPNELKAVVWHEAIHYFDWWANYKSKALSLKSAKDSWNFMVRFTNHGKFFIDTMNRINSGEGKSLVSVKNDTLLQHAQKPFYVYIMSVKNRPKNILFCWSVKKEQNIIDAVKRMVQHGGGGEVWHGETSTAALKLGARMTASSRLSMAVLSKDDKIVSFLEPLMKPEHKEELEAA